MPRDTADLPLRTSQRAAFALPCTVPRGIAYLRDAAVVLGALLSVERVILRQGGTYRITLAPITVPGVSLRPVAEVVFTMTDSRVIIRSIAAEPHDRQPGEVATHISGLFVVTATDTGCDVRASLRIAASISAHLLPPLMPRIIAQRTAETVLMYRMKHEVQAMTQALVHGYGGWESSE